MTVAALAVLVPVLAGTGLAAISPFLARRDGLVAVGGLVFGAAALANFLALGVSGQLLSGGTILVLQVAVGVEVTGAVALILTELLDQSLLRGR